MADQSGGRLQRARGVSPTRLVSVGDREAEVYALLAAERPEGVELVIRAAWDRAVSAPERSVWATGEAQPVVEHLRLQVPRRGPHPGRDATLALRFCPLTLRPPRHRPAEGLPAVALWAVQGREVEPPDGVEPIAWLLLTTVAGSPSPTPSSAWSGTPVAGALRCGSGF